jgi:hypothetical protein
MIRQGGMELGRFVVPPLRVRAKKLPVLLEAI